ncbi:hypothetical protein [Nannocystis punicea]|uniref:Uncharacterized protein n=1 Tax=Nannocystis punicea TaxID=2995304 RepID=A0ABY7GXS0_9BACT|nr:hypothetical protein [Nannocystis poenicansa]WAS91712.1 hypothetical protein O0S08_36485 [Nannocystis poenicansa]
MTFLLAAPARRIHSGEARLAAAGVLGRGSTRGPASARHPASLNLLAGDRRYEWTEATREDEADADQ